MHPGLFTALAFIDNACLRWKEYMYQIHLCFFTSSLCGDISHYLLIKSRIFKAILGLEPLYELHVSVAGMSLLRFYAKFLNLIN